MGRSALALLGLSTALLAGTACGSGPAAPTASQSTLLTYDSEHFHFEHRTAAAPDVARLASALEAERARVLRDLGVDAMPRVTVTYYADHQAMETAVAPIVGAIPAWAGGLVTAVDRIHLMSPSVPGWQTPDNGVGNLVHEFAHCVSLRLNPTIANNPRWWWEAVALFESGQRVAPDSLSYMRTAAPPPFSRLSSFDNALVYEVGYTIGEFVAARWGLEAVGRLVRANGDTQAALQVPQPEFEQAWFAFVRERYGL